MMRWLLFLILQVVISDQALPQNISQEKPLEPASVKALLESPDSKDQAWGAWLAGQGKLQEAVPLLQRIVENKIAVHGKAADEFLLDAALDALIQLEAKAPPALILKAYEKRPAHALVLLSKINAEADPLLLDLGARASGPELLAIANMLLERRVPGTAALLLKNLKIEAYLYIVDERNSEHPGEVMLGTPTYMIAGDRAAGYPPLAYYWLTDEPRTGDVVLATGPRNIFYQRVLSSPGSTPDVAAFGVNFDLTDRLLYIAALAGQDFEMPLKPDHLISTIGRGIGAPDEDIGEYRQEIIRRYSLLIRTLAERKLLTPEDASTLAEPALKLTVRDLRAKLN
jgi:hypothetical protein